MSCNLLALKASEGIRVARLNRFVNTLDWIGAANSLMPESGIPMLGWHTQVNKNRHQYTFVAISHGTSSGSVQTSHPRKKH